jgi:hypothetical protein
MPRHKVAAAPILPEWVAQEDNDCLRSVGEEVYTARVLAEHYGAGRHPSCAELRRSAEKALRDLSDSRASVAPRAAAGERALRKLWEAKVGARRFSVRGNGR